MFAVLDIGKTNKKTLILDSKLKIVAQEKTSLSEYESDGVRLEQPEQIFNWFLEMLTKFTDEYDIKSIAVTTQGASLVCLDKDGSLIIPPLAYTNDGGEDFDRDFFDKFGSKEVLQRETHTAPIGSMINCAKLIYYLQLKYEREFRNVAEILFYPQFFVKRLTGVSVTEPTYLGCHTYLYDNSKKGYSRIADELGIKKLLPQTFVSPWTRVGNVTPEICKKTGLSPDCVVTAGIHDSNSSLLPYIITNEQDFVLNSTGTWCVLMHRSNDTSIKDSELCKTIFYNFDAFANPVKTAVFMGGREFEVYSKLIESTHQQQGMPDFCPELYQEVLTSSDFFFIPSVEVGVGILPDSKPKVIYKGKAYLLDELQIPEIASMVFEDYERSFAALNCSIAAQSKIAIDYTNSINNTQLFIEGGFRKNQAYCQLLAELYPEAEVYTTNLEEATAMGAGILAKAALDNTDPYTLRDLVNITKEQIVAIGINGVERYTESFIELSS